MDHHAQSTTDWLLTYDLQVERQAFSGSKSSAEPTATRITYIIPYRTHMLDEGYRVSLQ
jgi:hypothetical protein